MTLAATPPPSQPTNPSVVNNPAPARQNSDPTRCSSEQVQPTHQHPPLVGTTQPAPGPHSCYPAIRRPAGGRTARQHPVHYYKDGSFIFWASVLCILCPRFYSLSPQVDGVLFNLHGSILAANSVFFDEMLSPLMDPQATSPPADGDTLMGDSQPALGLKGEGKTPEFPITIPQVTAAEFGILIDWLYTPQ